MNQHLHIITLGVRDFEKSKKFYTEIMGWHPSSAGQGDIAFFQAGGMVFSIYPREKLGEDALVNPEGHGWAG
ncbi:MAG TPA: VOC family protein, partial [Anaerolineales bacterium]|nr:VOC family protein [Anaerolineales bacterium]